MTTRIPLDSVKFDKDVRGPGPKTESHFSTDFDTKAAKHKGELAIEYDVALSAVRLTHVGDVRPEILVPWSRVVGSEPTRTPPPAKTKAA